MAERIEIEHCGNPLIHRAHERSSYEQVDADGWRWVGYRCEGNDDQDDPMFGRYECCEHCGSKGCPRRDGHPSACREGCRPGVTLLGEPGPATGPLKQSMAALHG